MSRRAVPGSNERPEGEFEFDTERPAEGPIQPGVYIVTQRPSSLSAKLLPPMLLIALGAGFLVYREAAADWRGLSAISDWFEPTKQAQAPAPAAPSAPAPAPAPEPTPPPVVAQNTEPAKPIVPALEPPNVEHAPKLEPDPLDDIQRQAEKEKERIAELEKLKAREEKKLAATADQRHQEQREEQLQRRGFNQQQLAQALAMQREFMRRSQQMFDQMHQDQLAAMQEMQERFLGRGGANNARRPQIPQGFGFGMMPQMDAKDGEEVVKRGADGSVTRYRRFTGPNISGFRMEFRSGNANGFVPPPPKPGLRGDNDPEEAAPPDPVPAPAGKPID